MRTSWTAFLLVALFPVAACSRLNPVDRTPSVSGLGGTGGTAGGGGGTGTSPGTGGAGDGLPCEVQAVFIKYCDSCHGASPSGGAPRSLVSYADLTRADLINNKISETEAALQRTQNKSSPMPPSPLPAPSAAEIATIQSWVASGYPKGACGSGSGGSASGGDAGPGKGGVSGGGAPGGGAGGGAGAGQGGAGGGAGGAGGSGSGGIAGDGLPCEIQTLVTSHCESCHGSPTSGGAPRSLVTYANLTASDPANPSLTEAQVALQRMQDNVAPMPPAPATRASSSEVSALQAWINSGYPKGSCAAGGAGGATSATGGSGGGGSPGGGGVQGGGGAGGQTGVGGSGVGGSTGGRPDASPSGTLPCDVQTLLASRCDSCHGATPSGGAPRSLVSYANLTSPDPSNPSLTEAQMALQRMQSSTSPMPPSPASPATSAEVATLQNWINAGYPSGSCSGDAGVPVNDPLNAAPTCTSKTTWTRGTNGSSSMEPGQACIGCHARSGGEAPTFAIAGTLYPTGHEPDNCNGASGSTTGAKVVVTGSNGSSVSLTPNGAGNFYSSSSLPGPYKAKVVNAAGVERVMSGTASTGDCNSCHTQNGANGAPGRITLP
jgi:hypothetical protein